MTLSQGGAAALGVIACVFGGMMNSTWPLFTKLSAPKPIRICSPVGWSWDHAWLAFTLTHVGLNAMYICCLLGTDTLHAVYSGAAAADVALVCMFSFLWGFGTQLYVAAIALLGSGLGTCLFMSLLVVIGTVLPLVRDYAGQAASTPALMTIAGLCLAIIGFGLSAYSSKLRQGSTVHGSGRRLQPKLDANDKTFGAEDSSASGASDDGMTTTAGIEAGGLELGGLESKGRAAKTAAAVSSNIDAGVPAAADAKWNARAPMGGAELPPKATSGRALLAVDAAKEAALTEAAEAGEKEGGASFLLGLLVCATGAIMASMLQFAFVFGKPIINIAEDEEGVPGIESPLVIWLLAFTLAGTWNIGYSAVRITRSGTWKGYYSEGGRALARRFGQVVLMSAIFLSHIHLYGTAQELFGDLGAVIAWPLLMSSTVLSGQLWGLALKEWVGAPAAAIRANWMSISVLIVSVTVIAIAGAVL